MNLNIDDEEVDGDEGIEGGDIKLLSNDLIVNVEMQG